MTVITKKQIIFIDYARKCILIRLPEQPGYWRIIYRKLKIHARILPRDNILVQFEDNRFKEDYVAWVDAELFRYFLF